MRIFSTKIRLVILGVLLLIAVAYLSCTTYLNSTGFRHMLLQQTNAVIDGRLSIIHHHLALLSGKLTLSGVHLEDHRGTQIASAQQMRIKLFWPALLWRHVQIQSLAVDKARLHLRYDHQDRLQLIKVKPIESSAPSNEQETGNKKWFLRIDDFRLNQCELHFERPNKGWSASAAGIEMEGGINLQEPSGRIQIFAGPLHWRQPEATRNLASLKITASMDAGQAIALKVLLPHVELDIEGRPALHAADPLMDLSANLSMDLEAIQTWLPETAALKGRLKAHLSAQGRPDNPTAAMDLLWTNGEAMGVPFEQITADLRLHQGRIAINGIRSQSLWGNLHLAGMVDLPPDLTGSWNPVAARWDTLDYELKLKGVNLQPAQLALFDFFPEGTFQLSGQMTGGGLTGFQAHGQAHIDIDAANLFLRPGAKSTHGRLAARLQWKGPEMELNELKASVGGSVIQAAARANPLAGFIEQAKVHFKTSRIEELGALLGIELPSGAGEINLQCRGAFSRPTAHIALVARQLTLNERPFGRLLAEARLSEKGELFIPRIVLENQGSLVQGNGQLTLRQADGSLAADPDVALNLAFQQVAPADFGFIKKMGGHFNGQVDLKGSLGHLKGETVLAKSPVRWNGFAGHAKGKGSWEDGRLIIHDLNLFNNASSLRLQGTAAWRRPGGKQWSATPHLKAKIDGRNILLQDFFQDYHGVLTLDGQISGEVPDLKGSFQVSGSRLVIAKQSVEHFSLQGRLAGNRIFCDTLQIGLKNEQMIKAKGWYGFDRQFHLNLEAADISLGHIAALQQAHPINGRVYLQLTASGNIENPQLSVDLKVHNPRLMDQPFNDFFMNAKLVNRKLVLAANLNFDLKARYHMDKGDFDVRAHFDRSELSPYLSLWAGKGWGGFLSGRLQASGNRHRPNQIQGELLIGNAVLRYRQQPVITVSQLHAHLKDQFLEIPVSRLALLEDGFINLAAKGRLPADLKVTSEGRLPVAALAPFFSSFEAAQGELRFQTRAQGALSDMQWHADLDLNGVGFDLPGLGQPIEDLDGHLNITPFQLTVQELSGQMDGGRFSLAGLVKLNDWRPIAGRLKLNAHALPLQWPGYMDVVMSGDITLEGAAASPQLAGKLVLLEGSYYKDVQLNLLSAVTQPRRTLPTPSAYSVPPQLEDIALNIAVTHRSPLLVDNNLANLQIAPDFTISGTLARPIVSGRAEVTEGEVVFQGKTFTIQRGVVDFINPYKIEPNLDILAQAGIRQWQVSLYLSGTPDQMLVKLKSNPEASENDILSLILLGRTSSEFSQGEGGQTTQQMLASLMGMAIGEDIKKISGLDILEVETGIEDDSQGTNHTQLTVGKRLSRRLTIKYEVESGDEEMVRRAVSEYRFLEHLLASGFQNSKGEYGSELLFRIEF